MKKKVVVIHHSADFDGLFCREIARKFLPEAELIGWDYGQPMPPCELTDTVYMLDISIDGMMSHPGLIWIDHHKSAMEKYPKDIPGYRIDGVAACRLAWQWFMTGGFNVDDPQSISLAHKEDFIDRRVVEPLAVRLAGEYDIWDKRDPRAELFQHGLRSRDLTNDWGMLLSYDASLSVKEIEALMDVGHNGICNPDGTISSPTVMGLLDAGKAIQYSSTKSNESIIKEIGFDLEWEGLKFLACNNARYNSHLFKAGLRPEHDACFGFKWTGNGWSVSLYHAPGKEHHDLSIIAVKNGGGGHRGACGFRTKKLPFLE